MRYVSYTRAKSNNLYSGLSCPEYAADGKEAIELQRRHVADYADSRGIEITKEYTEQDAECGGSAFQSLLADGMGRKFDCVVVDSIDRCGPSLWQAKEVLLETFQYAGISFVVVQDSFDSRMGNEAAEEYFTEKYSEWKRNHIRTECFIKNWAAKNPGKPENQDRQKNSTAAVRSPLKWILYDSKRGKPIRLKSIDGRPYFLLPAAVPGHKEGCPMADDELEGIVMDALDAEKALAGRVLERLKNGDGKEILQYRLSLVGAQMKQEFDRLAVLEFAEVEYAESYKRGEISEGEYRSRRAAQQEALMEADKLFKEAENSGEKLEKAFGFANPWILLMQSWERPDALTRPAAVKYLKKVYVRDFGNVEIITKMDEWKRLLPPEWLLC